ncbi:hypothetical protein K501DRAFT_199659 [Backusella circina FSU 941]|nr:hypothetical protein K501DRAFT_199659 [Backusella circina FSU 941]
MDTVDTFIHIDETTRFEALDEETRNIYRSSTFTLVYMSICLTCTIWQMFNACLLAWRVRKWLHFAVVFETVLSFLVILCSVLNSMLDVTCSLRFWVSIISVNLGGGCIQTILLYKAYICYDRAIWLLVVGSIINLCYIALTIVYATAGNVPTYKNFTGNCIVIEWPALAKLGVDIASNAFLSLAFLMVIYRHYKIFGNSLHKTLLSNGVFFSVGVITSNIVTAILISCRVMKGLSADLYAFDWVITSYLLIKQFKMKKPEVDNFGETNLSTCDIESISSERKNRAQNQFRVSSALFSEYTVTDKCDQQNSCTTCHCHYPLSKVVPSDIEIHKV